MPASRSARVATAVEPRMRIARVEEDVPTCAGWMRVLNSGGEQRLSLCCSTCCRRCGVDVGVVICAAVGDPQIEELHHAMTRSPCY